MSYYRMILSEQELSDFFEGNQSQMEQYADELERRLATDGDTARVVIERNALVDKLTVDGDEPSREDDEMVDAIIADMTNSWEWLTD